MKRKISGDVAILAIGFVLLAALTLLRDSVRGAQASFPSTYDTGRRGYAAVYELLAKERVTVGRFELPLGELPEHGTALAIAGDGQLNTVAMAPGGLQALDAWVKAGNTLYLLGRIDSEQAAALNAGRPRSSSAPSPRAQTACAFSSGMRALAVAGAFTQNFAPVCRRDRRSVLISKRGAPAIAYRRGRGTIVIVADPTPLDNWHLTHAGNARFAYALFARAGAVAFDERPYGYAAGRTFWQVLPWPVHTAIWVALAALLLAITGANIPFAPPYRRSYGGEPDSAMYIASVAGLLRRAASGREIVARLSSAGEALLKRAPHDERSRALVQQARTLRALQEPGPADVLAAGEFFAAVRKEFG